MYRDLHTRRNVYYSHAHARISIYKYINVYVCVRARSSSCRPAGRVLGIGQKRILPTKPKISRLITRRLIECRSFRALSAASSRALFHPLALRHTDSFSLSLSLSLALPFPLSQSPSRVLVLSVTKQRSPLAPIALLCERPSPPTSFLRHRSRSSFFPSISTSSSHSYSCSGNSLPPARRRTLLHFLRAFSPPRGSDASNTPPLLLAFTPVPLRSVLHLPPFVPAVSSVQLLAAYHLGKRQPPFYYHLLE